MEEEAGMQRLGLARSIGGSFIVPAASAGLGSESGPTVKAAAIKAAEAALDTLVAKIFAAALHVALEIAAFAVCETIRLKGKGVPGINASIPRMSLQLSHRIYVRINSRDELKSGLRELKSGRMKG